MLMISPISELREPFLFPFDDATDLKVETGTDAALTNVTLAFTDMLASGGYVKYTGTFGTFTNMRISFPQMEKFDEGNYGWAPG